MNEKNWKLFEKKSEEYLNNELKDLSIKVKLKGGSNSVSPDLELFDSNNKKLFSIESKLSPSQGGQIVIFNKGEKFEESELTKIRNEYSKKIIDVINTRFEFFNSEESNNFILTSDNFTFLTDWVKSHYLNKGSKFIITSTRLDSFFAIIPVEILDKFFDVKAVIRRKKSGTADVPRKDIDEVIKEIFKTFGNKAKVYSKEKKLILEIDNELVKSKYFKEYFLSEIEPSKFRIKKRSKTNNLNIVFVLTYTGNQCNHGLEFLKENLD